jgi:LuxR family maltose regulon positive regulatory protein
LAAGDAETATRLVTAAARDYVLRGEFATLRRWFTRLPEANIRAHPKLSLFYAWVLVNTGLVSHADDYLEALEANDDLDPALRGEMAVVRARAAVLRGDTEANLHFSKQALTLLPNDATLLRGDVALGLAFAHSDRQDFETARSYFEEAVARAREISHLRTLMLALYYLANTHLLQAQFSAAAQTYQRGLRACAQHDPSSALACWAYAGLGALAYEWNDSSQAEEQLQTALKLAQRCGEVKVLIYARKSLAFVRQTQGRHEDALALLHKAGEIAVQANIPSLVSEANVAKMICWAREGDLEAATSWAQQHGISLERAETDDDALTMLVWLRTAEARSLPETQRQRLLEPLVSLLLSRSDRLHTRDLIWPATQDVLSLAVIYQLLGDETRARSQLQTAVTLAAPSAPIRSFVDRGPSLASLLRELSESPRDVYVTRLLTAIEEEGSRPERSSPAEATLAEQPAQSMIEPLREREIDVLHHVAKGRTNKQIADEMVLAVSTVKWYLRNIYGKLQVHRRTQAVARARELNLL